MIYQKYLIVGYMLWARYVLLAGHLERSLTDIYAKHLESPGTQAFSRREVMAMCSDFTLVRMRSRLSFGDLLQGSWGSGTRAGSSLPPGISGHAG